MDDKEIFEKYEGFEFISTFVRAWNIIGFAAQKWDNDDPLEQRDTAVFMYYPDAPAGRRWYAQYLAEAAGLHGCAAFLPNERWVFLADDGEVFVAGQGDNDWESPVSEVANMYFTNVKSVRKGHAIAIGPKRHVYIRKSANVWEKLSNGLYPNGDKTNLEHAGFRDIDGFSEQDLYACGGRGDMWHYNGDKWTIVDIPTDARLDHICCGEDGFVYVTTNRRDILKGRGNSWSIISQEETDEVLEAIVCYNNQIIVSTVSGLFVVNEDGFTRWESNYPKMESYAHLATGDGILVVAGSYEASLYDGEKWEVIKSR
jgi:photosystem II stability/assembly factor-like uncharacterized protein